MAFINKETFDIIDCAIKEEENLYFECDELIAPTIRLLNLKGYKTEFCCQSHPYPSVSSGCTIAKDKYDLNFLAGVYYLEEASNGEEKALKHFGTKLKSGEKVFDFRCKQNIGEDEAYIVFSEGYEPPVIPEGWKIEEATCNDDKKKKICKIFDTTDKWKFFKKRLETMELLKRWADSLPVKK